MSWIANVIFSDNGVGTDSAGLGFKNVEAKVDGSSFEEALAGATFILNATAKGKLAYIRVKPEAYHWRGFGPANGRYRGYVRFCFADMPGEWRFPDHRFTPIPRFADCQTIAEAEGTRT